MNPLADRFLTSCFRRSITKPKAAQTFFLAIFFGPVRSFESLPFNQSDFEPGTSRSRRKPGHQRTCRWQVSFKTKVGRRREILFETVNARFGSSIKSAGKVEQRRPKQGPIFTWPQNVDYFKQESQSFGLFRLFEGNTERDFWSFSAFSLLFLFQSLSSL